MKKYTILHKISLAWFSVSILLFFGIESALNVGDEQTSSLLFINLAASFALLVGTAAKVTSHD